MTPRTKEQNEEIRLRRILEILRAAAEVYLNKGILLEIRDVAAEAGLGYGTVYHYYSNKNDLIADMLHQGLERADALWAGEELSPVLGADYGSKEQTSTRKETASLHVVERLREMCALLLHAWERDRALFLACYLGTDQYRVLQPEMAARLSTVYRSAVLVPLASEVEAILVREAQRGSKGSNCDGSSSDCGSSDGGTRNNDGSSSEGGTRNNGGSSSGGNNSSNSNNSSSSSSSNSESFGVEAERQAEWLVAALASCALPSIRQGILREHVEELVRFTVGRGLA